MADKGIIFSAPMVRALLDGTKTQTRRLLTKPATLDALAVFTPAFLELAGNADLLPYAPGDRLYVREAWFSTPAYDDLSPSAMGGEEPVWYAAGGAKASWCAPGGMANGRRRASMHMPRWASRLTLTVTDVRVQRLQDISEADAIAEGIDQVGRYGGEDLWRNYGDGPTAAFACPVKSYRSLWNSLHTAEGKRWHDNPWIVAVSFDVRHSNIDQVPA